MTPMSNETPSTAEATRFTLTPAPGFAVSHFGIGLGVLMAIEAARSGSGYTMKRLADEAGVHTDTIRRSLTSVGTFDAETLQVIAAALGRSWQDVALLGQRAALLEAGKLAHELEDGGKP